jgi:hypothetical protein
MNGRIDIGGLDAAQGGKISMQAMNLIEVIFVMAVATITFGDAVTVGRRFGLGWGLLAAPLTLAVVGALYLADSDR